MTGKYLKRLPETEAHFYINNNCVLLAIGSYTFPWAVGVEGFLPDNKLTADQLIELAVSYQLSAVQFGDNLPLHHFSETQLSKLKQKATDAGIALEVGARGLKKNHLLHYFNIAHSLNSAFLRIVIDDENFKPAVSEIIPTIKELLPTLRERRLLLAIENHDRFKTNDLIKIIQETDPVQVGICLDTANSIGAGESLRETVNALAPYCFNLHLKDITIKRVSHKMGFVVEGVPAGQGMLDLGWVLQKVKDAGRCGSVLIETWLNPEPTIGETIHKEKMFAENSINYIKSIIND